MDVEYSADIGTQLALPTYIVSKIRMRHISIANTLHYALMPCVCIAPVRPLRATYLPIITLISSLWTLSRKKEKLRYKKTS